MKRLLTSLILMVGLSWMPPLWGQTPLPSPAIDGLEVTQRGEGELGWGDRPSYPHSPPATKKPAVAGTTNNREQTEMNDH